MGELIEMHVFVFIYFVNSTNKKLLINYNSPSNAGKHSLLLLSVINHVNPCQIKMQNVTHYFSLYFSIISIIGEFQHLFILAIILVFS